MAQLANKNKPPTTIDSASSLENKFKSIRATLSEDELKYATNNFRNALKALKSSGMMIGPEDDIIILLKIQATKEAIAWRF